MNDNFMDAVNLVSFLVGIKNLQENLSQNDKQELMEKFDEQTRTLLQKVEDSVDEQNKMLSDLINLCNEILRRLRNNAES